MKDGEKSGLSMEDKELLHIMDDGFRKSSTNNWIAPLPFRKGRPGFPNNRPQAVRRAKILDNSLKNNLWKSMHLFVFLKKVFDNEHAEIAPPLEMDEECWYLPVFGVYHPRKPD